MKHFIHLSTRIINKLHIIEIIKKPTKYFIYMSNSNIGGFSLFSLGILGTNKNIIEICEINNKHDYDTITDSLK